MAKLSISNFKKGLGSNEAPSEENMQVMPPIAEEVVEEVAPTEVVEEVVTEEAQPTEKVENVETVEEIAPTEGVVEEVQPTENVKNEVKEINSTIAEPVEKVITDELVQSYLSEKLGRDVSLEDLTKEVVNPLDSDPLLKDIYEWRAKTGRPVEDFFKYQKDYSKVSDIDVAREFLQLQYPNSTEAEINIELRSLIPSEVDLDEEVEQKNWELKKLATKGRAELDKLKADLSEPSVQNLPQDVQDKVSYADKIKAQVVEGEKFQKEYDETLRKTALSTESIKLAVGDLDIDFFVSEDKRKTLPDDISNMPHWRNSDGSWNHKAVVEDGIKIKYFNEILKLVQEQSINVGKEQVIKDASNVTLGEAKTSPQNDSSNRGFIVEDANSGTKRKLSINSYKSK